MRVHRRWVAVLAVPCALLLTRRLRARRAPDPPPPQPDAVPLGPLAGRPRFVPVAGGSLPAGTPAPEPIHLRRGETVLGSAADADVHVHDDAVAAAHAVVVADDDGARLRDLTGTGSVLVDGRPALEADLVDGDRVTLGGQDLSFHRDT